MLSWLCRVMDIVMCVELDWDCDLELDLYLVDDHGYECDWDPD